MKKIILSLFIIFSFAIPYTITNRSFITNFGTNGFTVITNINLISNANDISNYTYHKNNFNYVNSNNISNFLKLNKIVLEVKSNESSFKSNINILGNRLIQMNTNFLLDYITNIQNIDKGNNDYFLNNYQKILSFFINTSNYLVRFSYLKPNRPRILNNLYYFKHNEIEEFQYVNHRIDESIFDGYKILPLQNKNNNSNFTKYGYIGFTLAHSNENVKMVFNLNKSTNDTIFYTEVPYQIDKNYFRNGTDTFYHMTNLIVSLENTNTIINNAIGTIYIQYTPYLYKIKIKQIKLFQ